MEDMLQETKDLPVLQMVSELSELLSEHKGQNVSVLDLRGINNWTDFFIIATVSSSTHMDGLERHVKDFCRQKEIDIFGKSGNKTDDEWRLIDLGSAVIHLMNINAREFYDLERLWRPVTHGV